MASGDLTTAGVRHGTWGRVPGRPDPDPVCLWEVPPPWAPEPRALLFLAARGDEYGCCGGESAGSGLAQNKDRFPMPQLFEWRGFEVKDLEVDKILLK